MIVGVTGFFCCGKDTMAHFLTEKGFQHISLSDMIREEIKTRGEEISIPSMTRVGNELREHFGPGILARRAMAHIDFTRNWVVTSIRHPAEIEVLRERPDFTMVFIDADQRVRFERSLTRARAGDPQTFEEFAAAEAQQMDARNGNPAAQQLAACREAADTRMDNNGTIEALREKALAFLQKGLFESALPRPSWDEYFMMIAEVAAMRANCIKRRIGAVIVHNQQILSTGYNGTPRGVTNCSAGGCPRCARVADSGSDLGECLCVHAEENALLQAAANGVAIRGATLYCTYCPCSYCAKHIVNAGIREVVFREGYPHATVVETLFKEAGIVLRRLESPKVSVAPVFRQEG
jgi:dCMP deaminase